MDIFSPVEACSARCARDAPSAERQSEETEAAANVLLLRNVRRVNMAGLVTPKRQVVASGEEVPATDNLIDIIQTIYKMPGCQWYKDTSSSMSSFRS